MCSRLTFHRMFQSSLENFIIAIYLDIFRKRKLNTEWEEKKNP